MSDQTQDHPGASGELPHWWGNVAKPLQGGTGAYQPPGYPTTTSFGVPTRFVPGPLNSGRLNQALDELQAQIGTSATYSGKLVTTSWVLNGANTTFPMLDTTGAPVAPGAATDLIVSLDGVIQQASTDYSISATNIVFVAPPPADATIWAVAGLPFGGDQNPFAVPVISTAGGAVGQFIAAPPGGYCAIVRSNGSSGYLLDAPSVGASFSANRPFTWHMSDGAVFIASNGSTTSVGGPLTVGGTATPAGPLLTVSTGLAYRNSNITDAQMLGALTAVSGISATLDIASGSTLVQAHALNGVVRNRNPSGTVGVCLNAFGTAEVDGAETWGCAWVLQDYPAIGADAGTGTGRLLQNELDFRVTHAATIVVGLVPTLDATVQPSNADAFVAGSTYNGTSRLGKWINGFRTYDNECVTAYYVGMSGGTSGTPNLLSQPVIFSGTNGAGAAVLMSLVYNGGTRTLTVQDSVGGNCNMAVNNTMTAGNFVTVAAGGGLTLGTSAGGNNVGSQSLALNTRDAGGTARTVSQTADANGNLIVSAPGGAFAVNGAAAARALTVSVGSTTMPGSLGVWGHAAPGAKPAAPVTLADVIAVLQSYGLCA